MNPKIETSGIIATYNNGAFVENAITSLLDQVDELIVVDDSSTDNTVGKILGIVKNHDLGKKIILLQNESNSGVSFSLNRAFETCNGRYLFLSGGDDVSLPNRVFDSLLILREKNLMKADLVYSKPVVIDSNGKILSDSWGAEFQHEVSPNGILYDLVWVGNFICAPSVAMSRELAIDTGFFHNNLLYTQDHDYWIRALSKGFQFQLSSNRLVKYRKHSNNLSRAVSRRSKEPKNLRQFAELDFVVSNFIENSSYDVLGKIANNLGYEIEGLSRDEIGIILGFTGNNLFTSRSSLRKLFDITRNHPNSLFSKIDYFELSARADVLNILEKKYP